jgi:galactose-1-phosphate uridylyltransferase
MNKVDEALDQLVKYERTFLTDLSEEEFEALANLLSKLAANFDTETPQD